MYKEIEDEKRIKKERYELERDIFSQLDEGLYNSIKSFIDINYTIPQKIKAHTGKNSPQIKMLDYESQYSALERRRIAIDKVSEDEEFIEKYNDYIKHLMNQKQAAKVGDYAAARNHSIMAKKTKPNIEKYIKKYMREEVELDEGVNDPAIFKAIFLGGGPGSGKSFIVDNTALSAMGFRIINSDTAYETFLKKAGLKTTPEDIFSQRGQEIRDVAKQKTSKKMGLLTSGRIGIVIDGTGRDYDKLVRKSDKLKDLGYDTMMLFVNTDLSTALDRNRKRERTLPDDQVKKMWNEVQRNIEQYKRYFGNRYIEIDNSTGADYKSQTLRAYRKISAWAKAEPNNPIAKAWIDAQRASIKRT